MTQIGCQGVTKYLAKIYFDSYLLQQTTIAPERLQLLGIAAVKLAVKVICHIIQFNESCDYPVACAVTSTGNQYTADEIVATEQTILQTLKFKLKVTTPFCYIKSIRELVPLNDETTFILLDRLLEYCSMLPELVGLSSGEVFFAVLIYVCKMKGVSQVRSILLALSSKWLYIE